MLDTKVLFAMGCQPLAQWRLVSCRQQPIPLESVRVGMRHPMQELVRSLCNHFRQQPWPSFSTHFLPCRRSLQWWQTSQPWRLPTLYLGRLHTGCVDSGIYSARAGYRCQQRAPGHAGRAGVPAAAATAETLWQEWRRHRQWWWQLK